MLLIARLYESGSQVKSAVASFVAAGYDEDSVAYLLGPDAAAEDDKEAGDAGDVAAAPEFVDMPMAVRAGKMLGEHADFYLSRLTGERGLVVATPPFLASKRAEEILDSHDPLPDSHRPPSPPFVPISEQATPFSNLFGWPALTRSATPFSDLLGLGFKQEGPSSLSRMFSPLAPDFTFSEKLGLKLRSSKDTIFPMATKSERLEGKSSSFGMGLRASRDTPFSSMLGLPLLSKRKHFLTPEYAEG